MKVKTVIIRTSVPEWKAYHILCTLGHMPALFSKLEVEMEENVLGVGTNGPSQDGGWASWQEVVLGNGEEQG